MTGRSLDVRQNWLTTDADIQSSLYCIAVSTDDIYDRSGQQIRDYQYISIQRPVGVIFDF